MTLSDEIMAQVVELRKLRGFSVTKLAERCEGITPAVLMNLESGRPDEHGRRRRELTVDELVALAKSLHVDPVDLLNKRFTSDKTTGIGAEMSLYKPISQWRMNGALADRPWECERCGAVLAEPHRVVLHNEWHDRLDPILAAHEAEADKAEALASRG